MIRDYPIERDEQGVPCRMVWCGDRRITPERSTRAMGRTDQWGTTTAKQLTLLTIPFDGETKASE